MDIQMDRVTCSYWSAFILFLFFPFTYLDYFQALSSRHSNTSLQQEQRVQTTSGSLQSACGKRREIMTMSFSLYKSLMPH